MSSNNRTGVKTNMEPSKIIGIQFSILSPDEIRNSSVAEITSRDTYINNKPVIGGLFDPRMGVLEPGLICPTDGLDYMQTPHYFGHIELARPVYYIQYFSTILKILKCVCFKCSKLKINKEKHRFCLKKNNKQRFDYVYGLASKVTRCGDENDNGCGCKQPTKTRKDGLATIIAEWKNANSEEGEDSKVVMNLTPEQVLKIFRRISDEDVEFMGFSAIWSRPDWMICQVLAVPPPAVRPSIKHDAQQRSEDDISHIIVNIIKYNKILQEKIEQNAPGKIIDDWHTILQYYIATMVNNKLPGVSNVTQRTGRALKSIVERLNGKTGRVRGNLMGKRVDYSSRSVITPDANLSIRELGVPKKIAMNLTYPERVNKRNRDYLTKLIINGPDVYPGAKILERKNGDNISLRYVDRNSIVLEDGDLVHRHLMDGDPVLFNRQPTLHRMSMMGHVVKVMKQGSTFRMNVADTKPYNADFDGDEMNMHAPQEERSCSELKNLAAVPKQIISPANNKSIVGIFQDSLLGCFRFTREGINFDKRTAMNLLMSYDNVNENMFSGKEDKITNFDILSQIIPPMSCYYPNSLYEPDEENKKTSNSLVEIINGKYVRGQMNKGVLESMSKGLLQSIYNDFGSETCADFIDNLQNIITEYMKLSSYSVGISDLIANRKTNEKIVEAINNKKQNVNDIIAQTHLGIFENNTGRSNKEEFETKINSVLNKAQEEAGKIARNSLDKDNRFVIMVNAGSKGKPLNIAQMISCLGQQNVDGKRIPYGYEDRTLPHYFKYNDSPEARGFVESSFIQGLTPQELFFHAMGGRTGLIDTAVKTSTTGYIQRRLIKGMEDLKVNYDMTVRNHKNKIIQFEYGEDGIDTMKIEGQSIKLATLSLEEIYGMFQIPQDGAKENLFTKETITRMNKQKNELTEVTKQFIDRIVNGRKELVENVFHYENNDKVYIPVNFTRIITNVKNQLSLKPNMLVDITPLEMFKFLQEKLESMSYYYVEPTKLFELVYYYCLTPKTLLFVNRFNKNALEVLLDNIITKYKKSIVHPGEMVGMIAAQSIGEPTTQMTLNTFHFAGVASKSNVTRGVPRIDEILTLTENPKNPSLTISLKKEQEENNQAAQEIMYNLEYTSLKDIIKSVKICFDPNKTKTNIEDDKEFMEQYTEFEKMVKNCADNTEEENEFSKWIIRFEMDRETMLDKNITMDDIHYTIENSFKEEVSCVYSDMNSDKLVFRIRVKDFNTKKGKDSKPTSLDQSDDIYKLNSIQENMLNHVILRGVKNIKKVNLRKVQNHLNETEDKFVVKESWVLDTIGTNLKSILGNQTIDGNRTISNNIQEVYATLGIEAARQTIYNELLEVIEYDGTYINSHHLGLLGDRMCATTKLVSIFRHGINNDNIGPIAQASFEETPEMFLRAAKHAQLDEMKGVSANVMCGQEGYFGTSSFQLFLDIEKVKNNKAKTLTQEDSIESKLGVEDESDPCSKTNISISTSVNIVNKNKTGMIDNSFDLDI